MSPIGKLIIFLGILLIVAGLVAIFLDKSVPLGRLPGDVTFEKESFKFYFPFTTGLVLSGVFSGLALLVSILF
ncbi:DUF2905 domain-containing protein [Candidatus Giovannonibacteria bacterium]|nr:DUF2905 domain-containing protein [Candidatus Giovannonibacteria bacterium]